MKLTRGMLIAGAGCVAGLLLLTVLWSGLQVQASPGAQTGWIRIYADTFTSTLPIWTINDTVEGTYHWGVARYTRTFGSLVVVDSGLWAAGGGSLGAAQSWPTGTYTNSLTTWAIAGPFTPTQRIWDTRLSLSVRNRVAEGDAFFFGLSDDRVHFTGISVTEVLTDWERLSWTTSAYSRSDAIWIGLLFTSNAETVATGPLVDNLLLEFNVGHNVYLPLIVRDPTPTPTMTPTPTPIPVFVDGFDNPASGWFVGAAERFNEWCHPDTGVCYARWEDVAYLNYQSGHYRMYVPTTWHGGGGVVDTWFVWPAQRAPLTAGFFPMPNRYCIEMRAKIANSWAEYQPYSAHWGLVIAGNAEMTDIVTFQVNANRNWAVLRYPTYKYPGNWNPDGPENVEVPLWAWEKELVYGQILGRDSYNTIKAVIRGPVAWFFSNDMFLGAVNLPSDMPRYNIGVIGGSWEVTPVELMIDYFRYDPFCPEAQP